MPVTIARPEGLFYLIFIAPERDWDEAPPHGCFSRSALHSSKLSTRTPEIPLSFWVRARRSSGRNVKQCSGGYN
jgi:hypothetical protein